MKLKSYFLVLILLILSGCGQQYDEAYYKTHPKFLLETMQACMNQGAIPKDSITCSKIYDLSRHLRDLMLQLQNKPQAFGLAILKLQMRLDAKSPSTDESGNQLELQERLALVKWLESPKG